MQYLHSAASAIASQLRSDAARYGLVVLPAASLSTYFEIVPPCPPTTAPFMTHVYQVPTLCPLDSHSVA
jgi:hypothetical protein